MALRKMPDQRSEDIKVKSRTFIALPPGHLSLILLSNSGQVPLAEVSYRIRLSPGSVIDGTTDTEGKLQHDNIPLGEYEMLVDGADESIYVEATPTDITDSPVRVSGFMLFTEEEEIDEDDLPTDEDPEEFILNDIDEEGWEDM